MDATPERIAAVEQLYVAATVEPVQEPHLEPHMSSGKSRRFTLPIVLAHTAGFVGANVVAGTIVVWSLNVAGRSRVAALPAVPAALLVGLGIVLMLVGSRSLALRSGAPTSRR